MKKYYVSLIFGMVSLFMLPTLSISQSNVDLGFAVNELAICSVDNPYYMNHSYNRLRNDSRSSNPVDSYGIDKLSKRSVGVNSLAVTITITETSGATSNDGNICSGDEVTLTASVGDSYLWTYNDLTTASITLNPILTTTYTVTVTTGGVPMTASATITVYTPAPIMVTETSGSTNNDGVICSGASAMLTASGGNSYTWSTNQSGAIINVTPPMTTDYTVTVTSTLAGCTGTAMKTIIVNSLPNASIAVTETSGANPNDGTICSGASATLTASGGVSYKWSNLETTAAITVSPITNTTYTVTVTNAEGCTAPSSRLITVLSIPSPSIGVSETSGIPNDGTICSGASATLTATGGGPSGLYAWSNGQFGAVITVMPSMTTTYIVTVTNANSCTNTATRIITVNQPTIPTIAITENSGTINDGTICTGASATLSTSGGTYSWSTGETTSSITVMPTSTTIYTVTVTTGGCSATNSATIVVNQVPAPSISVSESSGNTANDGIICSGASAILTASGGTSYSWSTGGTNSAITVMPLSTMTYTVTVSNTNGCSTTLTSTITVDPLPTASIMETDNSGADTNDGIICAGAFATLTASGGTSYNWSTGQSSTAINVGTTGTYTVTVTNSNGCSATSTATITVNPAPSPSIMISETSGTANNDGQICNGASVTLTASGGISYAWSNNINTAVNPVTPITTTIYTVTVTNSNSCTATSTVTITVNALPTPVISVTETSGTSNDDGIICTGTSATLTASNGTSYLWSNGQPGASIIVSLAGTYTVTATNANGCTATSARSIMVNALPTPSISVTDNSGITPNDGIICSGATATLSASGGTSYAWSNSQSGATITVTTGGTYTVTVINANGCAATTTRTVIVNVLPIPSISETDNSGLNLNDDILCQGATATLTANGGPSYAWSTGSTQTTINVTTAGIYTLTVTNANACAATSTKTITVNAPPSPSISVMDNSGLTPNDGIICSDASATLTASGGSSYNWSNSQSGPVITVNTAGTYTTTVTNSNGCTAISIKSITVNPLPIPSITVTDNSGTTANDGVICSGDAATLTGGGGTSYIWSTGATTASIPVTAGGAYIVTATNANGCSKSTSKSITVNPLPTPTITVTDDSGITPNDAIICAGDAATFAASTNASYAWSTGESSAAITVSNAGNYTVTVTNSQLCSSATSRALTVRPLPVPLISVSENSGTTPNDGKSCSSDQVTLTASGGTSYAWDNQNGVNPRIVFPTESTSYSVTATDANKCSFSTSTAITVFVNPTAGYTEGTNFNPTLSGSLTFDDNSAPGSGQITNWDWSFLPNGDPASLTYFSAQSASTIPNAIGYMTVKLTVRDANNCSNMHSDNFYIGASNSCTVNSITLPATPICEGGTVQLSANITLSSGLTNNIVWHWDFGGGIPISGENSANPIVKFDTQDTYNISVSFDQYNSANPNDPPCTSNTYTKTIVVNANPTGTLSTSTPVICEGESIKLNVGISDSNPSPSGYEVSISGIGTIPNVYNGQEVVVNSAPAGMPTYILQSVKNITTGCGTSLPVSISATVNQNPQIQAVTECNPQNQTWKATLVLTGKSPYTLVINGASPITVPSILYTVADIPLSTNNLVISISDANGCSGIYTFIKPLCDCPNPGPITMSLSTLDICEGTPSFTVKPVGGISNTTDQAVLYEILDSQTGLVKGSKSTTQFTLDPEFAFPANIVFDKKYIIRATVAKNNGLGEPNPADACKLVTLDSNTVIYFRRKPDVNITAPAVCADNTYNIKLGAAGTEYTFVWTKDGQPFSTSEALQFVNAGPNNFGVYAVTVTSSKGCISSNSITVDGEDIQANPTPNITGLDTTCLNQYDVVYNANSSSINTFTWQIMGGESITQTGDSISIHWTSSGTHILTVTERTSAGCIGTQNYSVTVSSADKAPNVAQVGYAPIERMLICLDNDVKCYQWGTTELDGTYNLKNPKEASNENNQAFFLGTSTDDPDDHTKLYWVDIWNDTPCGLWKDASCKTRCYYWRPNVSVHNIKASPFNFIAYPNPAISQVTLEFMSNDRFKNAELLVLNIDGRQVKREMFDIPLGSSMRQLDVSGLASGVYVLLIRDFQSGQIQRKSLIVQHN